MKLKNLLQKVKKINHKHILAIVFVFIIMYVGTAGLPIIFNSFRNAPSADGLGLRDTLVSVKTSLDDGFSEMLDHRDDSLLRDKGAYVNLNGLVARAMGQREMNRVIKLYNGHIFDPTTEIYDLSLSVARLTSLYERQQQYNRDFLFVMAPHQVSIFEDLMPAGFSCYANLNANNLVEGLRANGVPVLDLRYELYREGITHAEAFFPTDHHWLPEIGFWAYTKIYEHFVNTDALGPIDPRYTDINEFYIDIFEDWFIGSGGFRAGRFFAGMSDFQLVHPKFETDLFVELPWRNESMRGSFYDVLFAHQYNVRSFFVGSPYSAFLHHTYAVVHNDSATNDQTILSIHDSFGDTCIIFFPLMARENHFLDMRLFHDDFEVKYYEINPDIIIVLLTADQIYTPNTRYNFFNE